MKPKSLIGLLRNTHANPRKSPFGVFCVAVAGASAVIGLGVVVIWLMVKH